MLALVFVVFGIIIIIGAVVVVFIVTVNIVEVNAIAILSYSEYAFAYIVCIRNPKTTSKNSDAFQNRFESRKKKKKKKLLPNE